MRIWQSARVVEINHHGFALSHSCGHGRSCAERSRRGAERVEKGLVWHESLSSPILCHGGRMLRPHTNMGSRSFLGGRCLWFI
jgi:hypothetical protein